MGKRQTIALVYRFDEAWIAGSYYILNLIHALNRLEDADKPALIILTPSRKNFETVRITRYPYLQFRKFHPKRPAQSLFLRALNKIGRIFFRRDLVDRYLRADVLFPAVGHTYVSKVATRIFWIPDFQEHFLPRFFSKEEVLDRKKNQKGIVDSMCPVVLSSFTAAAHFREIFPEARNEIHVLQFAVTHFEFERTPMGELLNKYKIDGPYFFCANQFWMHKNHITLLKAIRITKWDLKKEIRVVFSGKEKDYRNPDYFNQIHDLVKEYEIEDSVRFLGYLDRNDQLQLMEGAMAVVQPSLFEGWSTVIEDAKALGQFVVASAIPVHREQISENVLFFDPENEMDLASHLTTLSTEAPLKKRVDYNLNVKKFGEEFMKLTVNP